MLSPAQAAYWSPFSVDDLNALAESGAFAFDASIVDSDIRKRGSSWFSEGRRNVSSSCERFEHVLRTATLEAVDADGLREAIDEAEANVRVRRIVKMLRGKHPPYVRFG